MFNLSDVFYTKNIATVSKYGTSVFLIKVLFNPPLVLKYITGKRKNLSSLFILQYKYNNLNGLADVLEELNSCIALLLTSQLYINFPKWGKYVNKAQDYDRILKACLDLVIVNHYNYFSIIVPFLFHVSQSAKNLNTYCSINYLNWVTNNKILNGINK